MILKKTSSRIVIAANWQFCNTQSRCRPPLHTTNAIQEIENQNLAFKKNIFRPSFRPLVQNKAK
jgi:hypothetical protein